MPHIYDLNPHLRPDSAPKPKRARNENGTLKADDPKTKGVNEAWEVQLPKKKAGRPKKKS
jgi:hypothetical protein